MGVSERFACRVTGQNRTTQRRPPTSTTTDDPDAALRSWLRAWAKTHPRRGFRPAYHDARGEGWVVNHKKIQRLWREEGLRVPQHRRRKRTGVSTAPNPPTADAPNKVWALDFQFDATTDGRPVKIASIVDEHTRECLGGMVERNITGDDLIDEPDRIAAQRGHPAVLRCDNGPELACVAMAASAGDHVGLHFIPPGEPWRNGHVESFNSRIRNECLTTNIFWPLTQARVVIADWKEDYNTRRRHSSLGHQPPAVHAAGCTHRGKPTLTSRGSLLGVLPGSHDHGDPRPDRPWWAPVPDRHGTRRRASRPPHRRGDGGTGPARDHPAAEQQAALGTSPA